MIYQVFVSEPSVNTNSTGLRITVPVAGNLRVVEFGLLDQTGSIGAGAVVQLRTMDGAGAFTTQGTLTTTASATAGELTKRLVDLFVDKIGDKTVFNGVETAVAAGITAVELNQSVVGAAATTGTFYIKCAIVGQLAAASTNETIVTV